MGWLGKSHWNTLKCVTKATARSFSFLGCEEKSGLITPGTGPLPEDMFVLVTEDGMECKSEDDKRWNGTGHPV